MKSSAMRGTKIETEEYPEEEERRLAAGLI